MLACIACTKDGGEDGSRAIAGGSQGSKDAGRSLTSQLKDMVLWFAGTSRQCKGGSTTPLSFKASSFHHSRQLSPFSSIDDMGFTSGHGVGACVPSKPVPARSMPPPSSSSSQDLSRMATADDTRWPHVHSWASSLGEEAEELFLEDDNREPKEWTAQVEPGVQITFISLPGGAGNDLKRIRFSREMFNKWEAQRWWGENFERVMELYNVQRISRQQGLSTPTMPSSFDDASQRDSFYSRVGSVGSSPVVPPLPKETAARAGTPRLPAAASSSGANRAMCYPAAPAPIPDPTEHGWPQQLHGLGSSADASRPTTSSRDEASVSVSNASDLEVTEWVEQDEPGVCITIRELPDGTRELRRIRFSRERFGEERAKVWWEENRERIQAQYL